MSKTLTIRIDDKLREALLCRARDEGGSVSALIRGILENALLEKPMAERIGHLKGSLRLDESAPDEDWPQAIHSRNWRS